MLIINMCSSITSIIITNTSSPFKIISSTIVVILTTTTATSTSTNTNIIIANTVTVSRTATSIM